ncbi:hypothetical protein X793_04285 [Dehalococcoides mccartyi CG4]|nr:hypothetical protein X793_04285 [Dehalococcoides mccartyi CG4]
MPLKAYYNRQIPSGVICWNICNKYITIPDTAGVKHTGIYPMGKDYF